MNNLIAVYDQASKKYLTVYGAPNAPILGSRVTARTFPTLAKAAGMAAALNMTYPDRNFAVKLIDPAQE